jgi:hypothetical protein
MDRNISKSELAERRRIIAEDCNGISPPFLVFYVFSIQYAAGRSTQSFEMLERMIALRSSADSIMAEVQDALTHAAALSRFFWPAAKDTLSQKRGTQLRTLFKIDDASALRDRALRNSFEHFDERLDEYLLRNNVGHFFPNAVVGAFKRSDEVPSHIFKLIDPIAGTCVILGEEFEYKHIFQETKRVWDIAEAWH